MSIKLHSEIVELIRSNRTTIAIQIKSDKIIVKAPLCLSEEKIQSFIDSKHDWIEKHLTIMHERQNRLQLTVKYTQEEIRSMADNALKVIVPKVEYYSKVIGVRYGRITIRNQKTRWGSCSSKGNLNFNCLLACMPDDVIDSVVVHELCHIKHMNHSKAFYDEIKRVFPKYNECNKWLKDNGYLYLERL